MIKHIEVGIKHTIDTKQTYNENHVIITYDYLSQNIPAMNRMDENKKKITVLLNCLSLLVPLFEREDY